MASRTFQIVAIVAAVAFVGTVSLTVMATGDGSEGQAPGDGFLSHLHKLGQRLHGDGHHQNPMADLHNQLVTQFERGYIEPREIRGFIDGHVEQIRGMAYAVTDELIELINGLDEKQREILLAHLRNGSANF